MALRASTSGQPCGVHGGGTGKQLKHLNLVNISMFVGKSWLGRLKNELYYTILCYLLVGWALYLDAIIYIIRIPQP